MSIAVAGVTSVIFTTRYATLIGKYGYDHRLSCETTITVLFTGIAVYQYGRKYCNASKFSDVVNATVDKQRTSDLKRKLPAVSF